MAKSVRTVREAFVIVGGLSGIARWSRARQAEERRFGCGRTAARDPSDVTGRIHTRREGMYALADVLCYPRRLTLTTALTTPLKPLEGMAMAKPVIGSDVPAMCELVSDGVTGLVFKAGDVRDLARKCIELLSDPDLQKRLGAAGRDWVVRERQWPSLVAKYSQVYSPLLERPLRRAEKIPA